MPQGLLVLPRMSPACSVSVVVVVDDDDDDDVVVDVVVDVVFFVVVVVVVWLVVLLQCILQPSDNIANFSFVYEQQIVN